MLEVRLSILQLLQERLEFASGFSLHFFYLAGELEVFGFELFALSLKVVDLVGKGLHLSLVVRFCLLQF